MISLRISPLLGCTQILGTKRLSIPNGPKLRKNTGRKKVASIILDLKVLGERTSLEERLEREREIRQGNSRKYFDIEQANKKADFFIFDHIQ